MKHETQVPIACNVLESTTLTQHKQYCLRDTIAVILESPEVICEKPQSTAVAIKRLTRDSPGTSTLCTLIPIYQGEALHPEDPAL